MATRYPTNQHAPTSARQPEPTGICARCSFYYPLSQLEWQWEWRGPNMVNLQIQVCRRTCLDVPNEQLRVIRIGPDPVCPQRPSPTFYRQQSQGGTESPTQFPPLPDE
jgi:hypothetical protein